MLIFLRTGGFFFPGSIILFLQLALPFFLFLFLLCQFLLTLFKRIICFGQNLFLIIGY